eukprot:883430-Prorocentrum_minimum.AAC.1
MPPLPSLAFAISMFCLDIAYDAQSEDMLAPAFEAFPEKDYCLLTIPHEVRSQVINLNLSQSLAKRERKKRESRTKGTLERSRDWNEARGPATAVLSTAYDRNTRKQIGCSWRGRSNGRYRRYSLPSDVGAVFVYASTTCAPPCDARASSS